MHQQLQVGSLVDTVRVVFKLKTGPLSLLKSPHIERKGGATHVISANGGSANIFVWVKKKKVSIEASIPKYFTGQNLFGIEHLHFGCVKLIASVLGRAGIKYPEKVRRRIERGGYRLTRIDFAAHLFCKSPESADSIMEAILGVSVREAKSFTLVGRHPIEYISFGSKSSRTMGRVYRKDLEILKKRKGVEKRSSELPPCVIRIEEVVRKDELKRLDLRNPFNWTPEIGRGWIVRRIAGLCKGGDLVFDPELTNIPNGSKIADRFAAFVLGDSSAFTRHPKTLYRQRKEVRRLTGVDVTIPVPPPLQLTHRRTLKDALQGQIAYGGLTRARWDELCGGR